MKQGNIKLQVIENMMDIMGPNPSSLAIGVPTSVPDDCRF
jgi:hypothetical protein